MSADIRRGALSLGLSRVVIQLLSATVLVVLARLLDPQDFALFAIAFLFINFLDLMSEAGLGLALIQVKDLTREVANGIFWVSLSFGCTLFLMGIFSANYIETFFGKSGVAEIIRWLSVVLIINAASAVPYKYLERQQNFKARARIDLYASGIGFTVSGTAAITGAGIWSLVLGQLVTALSKLYFSYLRSEYRPGFVSLKSISPKLLGFGARIIGLRLVWYAKDQVDKLVAGKYLGHLDFGYYSFAFQLTRSVQDIIKNVVSTISFSILSREQERINFFNVKLLRIYRYAAIVSIPVFLIGIVLAEPLIVIVFSEKWRSSVPIFQVFCVVQTLSIFATIVDDAFVAQGRTALPVKMNVAQAILLGAGFYVGALYGISGILVAWILGLPLLSAVWIRVLLKTQGIPLREYLHALMPALMGAAGIATAALGLVLLSGGNVPIESGTFIERAGLLVFDIALLSAAYILGVVVWGMMAGESIWKELRER